jgi:hypothetical protein
VHFKPKKRRSLRSAHEKERWDNKSYKKIGKMNIFVSLKLCGEKNSGKSGRRTKKTGKLRNLWHIKSFYGIKLRKIMVEMSLKKNETTLTDDKSD